MLQWKDIKANDQLAPDVSEFRLTDGMRLIITKTKRTNGQVNWLLSVEDPAIFDYQVLSAASIEEAKYEALRRVRERLALLMKAASVA